MIAPEAETGLEVLSGLGFGLGPGAAAAGLAAVTAVLAGLEFAPGKYRVPWAVVGPGAVFEPGCVDGIAPESGAAGEFGPQA